MRQGDFPDDCSRFASMRRVKTTAAPSTAHPASRSSPTVKLPVRSFRYPIANGPAKPDKLPSELIAAMPAAADAPVRKLAGNGQNIGGTEETPICAKQSSVMTMMGLEMSPDNPIPIAAI